MGTNKESQPSSSKISSYIYLIHQNNLFLPFIKNLFTLHILLRNSGLHPNKEFSKLFIKEIIYRITTHSTKMTECTSYVTISK